MSIMLPVTALSDVKFANRPKDWRDKAKEVLVNTECSMFGKNILPMTRWDDFLNNAHKLPDFQPYEYLIGGRYLSEIVRLVLVEAVQKAGLFHGEIPHRLLEPYSLDTGILAYIEEYVIALIATSFSFELTLSTQRRLSQPATLHQQSANTPPARHSSHRGRYVARPHHRSPRDPPRRRSPCHRHPCALVSAGIRRGRAPGAHGPCGGRVQWVGYRALS
jgi:hypothetical protein